ncbi:MAG: serine/threonine-protein kinase PknK [Acidobacteriota bacterium]
MTRREGSSYDSCIRFFSVTIASGRRLRDRLDRKQISYYRIIQQLGSGGVGVVYLAEDLNIGRQVVLKVLRADLVTDSRVEERFRREARACASISHPNITTIFEVDKDQGISYICMEFVEGRTLRAILRERKMLPPPEVIRIAAGIAEALAAAHERGVVHRDIKPENIMMKPYGGIKVLDFGLATFTLSLLQPLDIGSLKTVDRLTSEGMAVGTLHYMSPEQARGSEVTPASDIFSLGAVLYEALAGMPPFRGDNSLAVMHAIFYDEPPALAALRPETPAEFERLIARTLRKDPARRIASGGQLRRELSPFLPGKPAEAATASPGMTAGPLPGRPARESPTDQEIEAESLGRGFLAEIVGRDREMAAFSAHMERAFSGHGSLVLIAGEAGIGKTRLVEELARSGQQRGARYVAGRCLFREGSLPYHPFIEAAGSLVHHLGLRDASDFDNYIHERLPALAGRLPILRSFLHPAGEETTSLIASKEHLLDAISALFIEIARDRPLILHIDDLQWADEATLDLLLYLARNCGESHGLIVGTYRPDEVPGSHPLSRLKERMSTGDPVDEIRLERLGNEATAGIVSSAIRGAELPAEFLERLHAGTDGNPFYILETLKLLVQDGFLVRQDDRWALAGPVERIQIPGRVRDVVSRRLEKVPDTDREVLQVASLEGMVFHSGTLASCLELSRIKILGALQRAEKQHRLVHAEENRYTFDHPIIREILAETIIPELRREYHRLIGEFLASHRSGRPGEDAAIAYQLLEAGEDTSALPFLLDAGDQARRLYANAEAIALLNRAEEILHGESGRAGTASGAPSADAESARQLLRLHKERGRLHLRLGHHDEALKDLQRMNRLATEAGLGQHQAHSLCLMAELRYAMGEYDHALDLSRDAHDLATKIDDKRSLSHALRLMGAIHFYRAEYDEAIKAHYDSIAIQKELDDLSGYADNLGKIGNIHLLRGERDKAEAVYSTALALGRQSGNRLVEAEALNNLGLMYYYGGAAAPALDHLERCLTLKREIGDQRAITRTLNNLALVQEMMGDFRAAVATHKEALVIIRALNDQGTLIPTLNNFGNVLEKMGRYGQALSVCRESLDTAEAIGDRWVMPYALNSLGQVLLWLNQVAQAEALFERALRTARRSGHRVVECLSLKNLGAARREAGRPEDGLALLGQALELARDLTARDRQCEILYLMGQLHADRDDPKRASACSRELAGLVAELGLREATLKHLHLSGRLAAMLRDRPEAGRILAQAVALAGELGLKEVAWRVLYDRALALGSGPESADEIKRAASILREVAATTGSADLSTSYLAHPLRRKVLALADSTPRAD